MYDDSLDSVLLRLSAKFIERTSPVQIYGISLSNNYAFVPKNQRAALIYINLPSETVMYRSYGIIISDAFVPKNQFINGALV